MGSAEARRLIVTADDFGRSASINSAVALVHRKGILTCASLMVNEEGFEEAVEIATANPRLGVGLHLTLCCGHAALSAEDIPDLVNGCTRKKARAGQLPNRLTDRQFLRQKNSFREKMRSLILMNAPMVPRLLVIKKYMGM